MSNDIFNNSDAIRAEQEQLRRQNAELQRDVAINVAADQSVQRDAALNVAANQADQRDAAVSQASLEALRRHDAEQNALSARTVANQASSQAAHAQTESTILRENLASERANASNTSFGFYMLGFCVLAAVIGLGIWYFNTYNVTTVYTAQPTSSTTTVNQPPVNVNVQPSSSPPSSVIVMPPAPSPVQPRPAAPVKPSGGPAPDPDPAPDASKSDNGPTNGGGQ